MVIFVCSVCNRFNTSYTVHIDNEEALERLQAACVHGWHKENSSRPRPAAVCTACTANVASSVIFCYHTRRLSVKVTLTTVAAFFLL